MADQSQSRIIQDNPIGRGLDAFRSSLKSICESRSISCTSDGLGQLGQEDLRNLALPFLVSLQSLPTSGMLLSKTSRGTLRSDLLRLISAVTSDDFDFDRINPLLNAVLADKPDKEIWDEVYNAVTESTPPPRPIPSFLEQTPWLRNTSSFANSSEYRKHVDAVLKEELGSLLYAGLPNLNKAFFGGVAGLETASEAVFKKCMEGSDPLFRREDGWRGWPKDAKQSRVLDWFAELSEKLATFAEGYRSTPARRLRPLVRPDEPIDGSIAKRKMDVGFATATATTEPGKVGFVNDPKARKGSRCHWSQVLVLGELKSNPADDQRSKAWLDLGRYAREVLAAQDTRRFALGFTICGSLMRAWEFDRLGGIGSDQFDLNKDGLRFVSTILGFFWMNEEELGFDPTIITTANGQRFIKIERNGSTERLVIDGLMRRARCVAGRATTCWRAHREGGPQMPLVIKDSWQYPERDEEGEFLREATSKDVVNVARYYHHETVQVLGTDDDVRGNLRKGLDITMAENYQPGRPMMSTNTSATATREGRSSSTAGRKRPSSQTDAPLPPSKRSHSASPTKASGAALPNRVHRRVILRDYGKPIYEASSRAALLGALAGCITGHESLHKAGLLHRDISVNNLMINEDEDNPSWPSFLIDLDLGIKEARTEASGAQGKTGTRAFMAIGALLGEQHSFMHDLESFFWVLFWICIHYEGPGKDIGPTEFESWNYESDIKLVLSKKGVIDDEEDFLRTAQENFTTYYEPLIPWVNRLRRKVFPNGGRWKRSDPGLYYSMKGILREAQEDPKVAGK